MRVNQYLSKHANLFVLFSAICAAAIIGTVNGDEEKQGKSKWDDKQAWKEKPSTKEFVVKKEFAVKQGGTLRLDADLGSVEVIPVSGARRVSVEVIRTIREKYAKDATAILRHHQVEITKVGNDAVVRSELKPLKKEQVGLPEVGFDVSEDVARAIKNAIRKRVHNIHFRVSIPSEFNIKLKTGGQKITCGDLVGQAHCNTSGGGIKLGKIAGRVHATTSGGSLKVASAGDSVELRTSGGSIQAGDIQGDAVVATSGGSIELGEVRGRVSAKTSGGSIRIKDSGGAVEAITSGGSIRAAISKQPKGDSFLATSGGKVDIALAKGIALNVEHQGHGRLSSPFSKNGWKQAQVEKLNGGGPRLVTKGNVRIAYLNDK
ncbi:MAG: hypothetical protein AAF497_04105 [Planctomycetota bacterium]